MRVCMLPPNLKLCDPFTQLSEADDVNSPVSGSWWYIDPKLAVIPPIGAPLAEKLPRPLVCGKPFVMAPVNPSWLFWSNFCSSGNSNLVTIVFTYPTPKCNSKEGRIVLSTFRRAVLDRLVLNPAVVMLDGSPSVLVWPEPPT